MDKKDQEIVVRDLCHVAMWLPWFLELERWFPVLWEYLECRNYVWDAFQSTALLFAEMLMTKKGHKPNPIREKGGRSERYYKRLINVFSNPIAISIVAYENYKIALQPGFYNSRFVPLTQERKKYYNEWMQSQNLGWPLFDAFTNHSCYRLHKQNNWLICIGFDIFLCHLYDRIFIYTI